MRLLTMLNCLIQQVVLLLIGNRQTGVSKDKNNTKVKIQTFDPKQVTI